MIGPEANCDDPAAVGVRVGVGAGFGVVPLGVLVMGTVGGSGDWNKPCPRLLLSMGQVSVELRAEGSDTSVGRDGVVATGGREEEEEEMIETQSDRKVNRVMQWNRQDSVW